jgi:hypothetical protein
MRDFLKLWRRRNGKWRKRWWWCLIWFSIRCEKRMLKKIKLWSLGESVVENEKEKSALNFEVKHVMFCSVLVHNIHFDTSTLTSQLISTILSIFSLYYYYYYYYSNKHKAVLELEGKKYHYWLHKFAYKNYIRNTSLMWAG